MFKVLESIVGHSIHFQDGIGFSHLCSLCYWYIAAGKEAALQLITLQDVGADCCNFISQATAIHLYANFAHIYMCINMIKHIYIICVAQQSKNT